MSEVDSATDTGAEQSAQNVDPVNAFESLLDKSFSAGGENSDEPNETPSDEEPEPEQDSEESEDAGDDTFTLKIDGKEVQVSRDELIAHAQKGLAANQRFEQAANERKAAQAEYQQVAQQRLQAINSLHIAQQVIQSQIIDPNTIDHRADPLAYLDAVKAYEGQRTKLAELQQQQMQLQQIQAQDEQAQMQANLQRQQQMLLDALPDWKDEGKAAADRAALKEYLGKQGITQAEIDNLADARFVLIAREAMLYRQMMAKAQEASKKVQTLPKVQRPGVSRPTDSRTRDMQALRKTGSTAAAASIFEKLL